MARSATTTDAFNAIAEQRRREIIGLLAERERTVGDLVDTLGDVTQPQVSKHLRVLREVGLVDVREDGRLRRYSLNAFVASFEGNLKSTRMSQLPSLLRIHLPAGYDRTRFGPENRVPKTQSKPQE